MKSRLRAFLVVFALGSLARPASVQAAGPGDYDLKLVAARSSVRPGEEVSLDAKLNARQPGVLAWSYGVRHDASLLEVLTVGINGTDVPALLLPINNFHTTRIITEEGGKVGWVQAVILSLAEERREVPVGDNFVMARARYRALGTCSQPQEQGTQVSFSGTLRVPPGPPLDVSLSVESDSVVPAVQEVAQLSVQCPSPGTPAPLSLLLQPDSARKLVANGESTRDLKVLLRNNGATPVPVQGWSYGIKVDTTLLQVDRIAQGEHTRAVNGGAGPDFTAYTPNTSNGDNTVFGLTVAVVISINETPPLDEVLTVPAGATRHLETITVRARAQPVGGAEQTANLAFVTGVLGGNEPAEIVIVSEGVGTSLPGEDVSASLVVQPPRLFKRGYANRDSRFDIGDGIYLVQVIFYGFQGGQWACEAAADANGDGGVNLADVMYILNYLLQPGKLPGQPLFPRPPEPFTTCGTGSNLPCDTSPLSCP